MTDNQREGLVAMARTPISSLTMPANDIDRNMIKVYQDEQREIRRLAKSLADAAAQGSLSRFNEEFRSSYNRLCIREGFQAIVRSGVAAGEIRQSFVSQWILNGDEIRDHCGQDTLLLDALRVLLPPYSGASRELFRGESFHNRRYRRYGMSWTLNIDIARDFACIHARMTEAGGVLLRAQVPADAIMFDPHTHANEYAEDEFIVDRRLLTRVDVIERCENASESVPAEK